MTETANRKGFELDYLLHPAGAFRTPMEDVNDPDMTVQEKRAILASWASDAFALGAAAPAVRPLDPLRRDHGRAEASRWRGGRQTELREIYQPRAPLEGLVPQQ